MGWLALIRLAVIFALSFVALPVWAAKGQSRANPVRLVARSFIWLSFFLHFSIAILGAIRLALPGAVLLLYLLWIAALFLWGRPSLLLDADAWRLRTARLIGRLEELRRRRWMEGLDCAVMRIRAVPGLWFALSSCCLAAHSWYPVHNLRFVELEGYSRSLSLATLCAGQPWKIDPSVPLLAPLVYLSALDAPAVVSLS